MIRSLRYKTTGPVSNRCDGCGKRPRYQIQYLGTGTNNAVPDLCVRCAKATVSRLEKLLRKDGWLG